MYSLLVVLLRRSSLQVLLYFQSPLTSNLGSRTSSNRSLEALAAFPEISLWPGVVLHPLCSTVFQLFDLNYSKARRAPTWSPMQSFRSSTSNNARKFFSKQYTSCLPFDVQHVLFELQNPTTCHTFEHQISNSTYRNPQHSYFKLQLSISNNASSWNSSSKSERPHAIVPFFQRPSRIFQLLHTLFLF